MTPRRRGRGKARRYPAASMAKAVRVLAALKRDGWIERRQVGSHRVLVKGDVRGSGLTMTVLTWAVRRWRWSPRTTGTPSLSCAGYRDDENMSTTLRAEFYEDDQAKNWHYRVPALHINGGGTRTRIEAERECLEAIAFALQGDPSEYDSEAVTITLDVSVAPAA